jgi:hypothetical protein
MAEPTGDIFDDNNLDYLKESIDYSRILIDNAKLLIKLNRESGHTLYEGFKTASTALAKSLDKINLNYAKYQKFEIKRKEIEKDISNIQKYQNQLIAKREALEKGELVTLEKNYKLQEEREAKALQRLNSTKISSGGKYKTNEAAYQAEKKKTEEIQKQVRLLSSSLDLSKDLEEEASRQVKNLEAYNENLDSAQKKIAFAKGLFTNLSKIPILGGFIDAEKGIAKMEQQALLKKGFWTSLGKSTTEAFSSLAKASLILIAVEAAFKIFKFIVGAMFAADKQITDIARRMGLTKSLAIDIRNQFINISKYAEKFASIQEGVVITQKETYETWAAINDQLGTAVKFGDRFLAQMTIISTKVGLTAEAMKGLTLYTQQSGIEAETILGNIAATNNLQKLQGKSLIENKKLLESTFKTVGYIRTAFKGSVTELAKGVAQAHAMSITLEKINSIADSFLDFESSISSELEAQLLTGRDINLDAARYYALTNQTSNLMTEIQKTFPSWKEFNNQNRIAAEAQAKAVGMTKDELSDTIFEQETLNKLKASGIVNSLKGADLERFKQIQSSKEAYKFLKERAKSEKDIAKLLEDQAYQRLQTLSAEDKFNQAIEKLKETIGNLFTGEFIDRMVTAFTSLVNGISKTSEFFEDINHTLSYLLPHVTYDEETFKKWHPEKMNKQDDFISRGGSITSFRKDDLVIGGTSLLNNSGKSSEELTQLRELNSNIKSLINIVEKGHDIVMDPYKVGSSIGLAAVKIQ